MPVITPENYSLSFGHLADVIPPASAYDGLGTPETRALGATWFTLASQHGVCAALNRLLPEHKYAGDYAPGSGNFTLKRSFGNLTVVRSSTRGSEDLHFRVYGTRNPGPDTLPVLSTEGRMITGGPWLRELETAANKQQMHRFECGAVSFHKWLKTQLPAPKAA